MKNPKLAFSISDADMLSDDSAERKACDGLAAVILNRGESPKRSLYETLRICPFGGVELNVERDHSIGRPVELA